MNFLQQVASYYASDPERASRLCDYTFVLPNKRSAMYMRKYLKEAMQGVGFMPKLVTITAFTQQLAPSTLAKPVEQLFMLYDCYRQVMKEEKQTAKDFDTFVFWGNVVLQDFSDIDAYMVDAQQLFRNISDLNEIQANYLTQEQIDVLKMLGDKRDLRVDEKNFWQHMPSEPTAAKADKFVMLWQILGKLYKKFNDELDRRCLAYSGKQSKQVLERLRSTAIEDFGEKRFAFIGFYVLSTARTLIFQRLKGISDFFWDTASPMLREPGCRAGDFILPLASEFKMPADFELEPIDEMPRVDVYQVPSNSAQAKLAGSLLKEWQTEFEDEAKRSSTILPRPTTGVVIPTEKLLTPMLHAIPDDYYDVNLAMKVPLSSLPFATFLFTVLRMQENMQKLHGLPTFYFKDVLDIVSSPFVAMYDSAAANEVKALISKHHLYNVSVADIAGNPAAQPIAFIFTPAVDINAKAPSRSQATRQIHAYLSRLIDSFAKIEEQKKVTEAFRNAVDEILAYTDEYDIAMHEHTYFALVRKMLGAMALQFNTSPVQGLQLMSVPDSRLLDFDNLIVMGANERILPKFNPAPSLIPPSLRIDYGLPTLENEEATSSFLFFRLISRASKLALLYDSRTPDLSTGEVSRYVRQLQHVLEPKGRIRFHNTQLGMKASATHQIAVKKDATVMANLEKMKHRPGQDEKEILRISASSLKHYIQCPLKFYLEDVKNLRFDDFDPEYMDAASYGSVLHAVAEIYYAQLSQEVQGGWITPDFLKAKLAEKAELEKTLKDIALKEMDRQYYRGKYEGRLLHIPGEGQLLARLIARYVMAMLKAESEKGQFKFKSGEYRGPGGKKTHAWAVTNGLTINFTMSIDRIDALDDQGRKLRFIDYKTGSDALEAPSVDALFDDHDLGAIFQLLLYSIAYAELEPYAYDIEPVIYKITTIPTKGIEPIKITALAPTQKGGTKNSKNAISNYAMTLTDGVNLKEHFRSRLVEMLTEIFKETETNEQGETVMAEFRQTDNIENCKYCNFAQMCGRAKKEK